MPTAHYLASGGRLATQPLDAADMAITWTHDPERPVPTIGAAVAAFFEWIPVPEGIDPAYVSGRARMRGFLPDGPMHQRERKELLGCATPYPLLSERADVMVFQTEPLQGDVEITGPIEARLFVSSDCPDTDFTAKLIDVHPPTSDDPEGFHMNLSDAILRMRFRDGLDRERPIEPGRIYEIVITLPPTANLFKAGHRIRVDIASSNFPQFDVNPNTGEPLGRHTHKRAARNSVHVGPLNRSHITLSVMPARS